MRERQNLADGRDFLLKIAQELTDADELLELADDGMLAELLRGLEELREQAKARRLAAVMASPEDAADCYLELHPGAGGDEATDWASMLLRMYTRWAERRGFKYDLLDAEEGDHGLKRATVLIKGENAYGWLKHEAGAHRLVRISPFDSNARRHTSFCSVIPYPDADRNIDIEIDSKELRIDTYRSSGRGGQHAQKSDSAIRITHLPTGVSAACEKERSQHKNKATAMQMLKAKLFKLEEAKQQQEWDEKYAADGDNAWGHQIRSYVLQPYQMVKDLRTGYQTANIDKILDGDLDLLLEASLTEGTNHANQT